LEVHQYFWELRQKHYAHDVNDFRRCDVAVILGEGDEVMEVVRSYRRGAHDLPNFLNLLNLVERARQYVEHEIDGMVDQLTAEVSAMPAEERGRLPSLTISAPEVARIKERRR
jgi:hypothetical protein